MLLGFSPSPLWMKPQHRTRDFRLWGIECTWLKLRDRSVPLWEEKPTTHDIWNVTDCNSCLDRCHDLELLGHLIFFINPKIDRHAALFRFWSSRAQTGAPHWVCRCRICTRFYVGTHWLIILYKPFALSLGLHRSPIWERDVVLRTCVHTTFWCLRGKQFF